MFSVPGARRPYMTVMTDKAIDPRDAILKAAGERILHYGYNKTTMAEVAADCSMSAGNIYRFFPSKIDIAEAMTRAFSAETHQHYSAIVRDTGRSPTQKLLDFFTFRMERTFRLFEKNPKLMELAAIMGRERPEYLAEERAQERLHVEKILEEGQKAGEFTFDTSLTMTADFVQCAVMKFRFPQLWTTEHLDALKFELEGVLSLMLTGLSARC
jgi:AcrR family transcriptional regulator